ncbi:MAG: DUF6226 family protein [Dietzia sp.]
MTNGRPGATWWQERDHRLRGLSGAWVRVLDDRGWAQLDTERTVEQRGPHGYTTTTIILRPEQEGAVPLETPGCGCDACDSGSSALLEELDQWVLSVVDGSLVVDPAAQLQVRTSLGGPETGRSSTRSRSSGAASTRD